MIPEDKQRDSAEQARCTFILDYSYFGRTRRIKQQMVEMNLNSSGIGISLVLGG